MRRAASSRVRAACRSASRTAAAASSRAAAERRFSLARMAADYERLYRAILEHPGQLTLEPTGTGAL